MANAMAAIEPALRAAVDRLPETERAIAGYQFCWWDEHGRPTPGRGGKGLRPALVLSSTAAAGVTAEHAIGAAVSVELVHNFSLLHDDIMDGDVLRRGRPSAWAVYGQKATLLAGDALLVLAMDVLAETSGPRAPSAIRSLCQTLLELAKGQSQDIAFEKRPDVELLECLTMAGRKTASLTRYACSIGPSIAGIDSRTVQHLQDFGYHLGLAFQLMDDLIGIWGNEKRTGKPVGSDLLARKKTLPVVAALASSDGARARLAELYASPAPLTPSDVRAVIGLIERLGGRAWTEAEMRRQLDAALSSLDAANLDPAAADELAEMASMAVRRDH
ncbi:polyprenyl synthetase family protein [Pendulispora brunnea]|uniref:Polyprenyl synthetase family protein n=1 Tax=Pendulispora brunnea TaxID=2905690 RepID=A0ABZ2KJT9_9BACT